MVSSFVTGPSYEILPLKIYSMVKVGVCLLYTSHHLKVQIQDAGHQVDDAEDAKAVSYTHLDVYKRQASNRAHSSPMFAPGAIPIPPTCAARASEM